VSITVNPVLRRELVERWRGRRAFVVITAYVALLGLVTVLLYWIAGEFLEDQMRWGGFQALAAGPAVGRFLFENLLAFVLLLVLFIAPGYAAAQISGERERRTLALLQITLVRPAQIVAGKLGASVAWLLLLVVAALPFGAVAFFLGGVSLGDLVRGLVTLVVVAVCVAAISLGISSFTRRTTASVVLTYGLVLALLLGTLFAALVESAVREFRFDEGSRPVAMYANPFYGLADAVRSNARSGGVGAELPSVLTAFGYALPNPRFGGSVVHGIEMAEPDHAVEFGGGPVVLEGEVIGVDGADAQRVERRPVWLITLGIYLALGVLGFLVATRRVGSTETTPRRRGRRRRGRGEEPVTAGAGVPVGAPAGAELPPPTGQPFVNDPSPPPAGGEAP
jgi:ABC-2 type transport system permease protein